MLIHAGLFFTISGGHIIPKSRMNGYVSLLLFLIIGRKKIYKFRFHGQNYKLLSVRRETGAL
jgi:hypothetical protein